MLIIHFSAAVIILKYCNSSLWKNSSRVLLTLVWMAFCRSLFHIILNLFISICIIKRRYIVLNKCCLAKCLGTRHFLKGSVCGGVRLPNFLAPSESVPFTRNKRLKRGISTTNSTFQTTVITTSGTAYTPHPERKLPFIWNWNCVVLVQTRVCSQVFCGTA